MYWHTGVLVVVALLVGIGQAAAATVTGAELRRAREWTAAHLTGAMDAPFSFEYGGRQSAEFLADWQTTRKARRLDANRTETVGTYTDPVTGLRVTCTSIAYRDYPAVEWTLRFANTHSADTPIISNIRPLDLRLTRPAAGEYVLRTTVGDYCVPESYQPIVETLAPGTVRTFAPSGGRPTDHAFPYWNLGTDGGGVIAALGWPGQWSARLERDAGTGLHLAAGQELTHFVLHKGEEVRSPLSVVMFYDGDAVRGQNVWRRWMMAHNLRRPGGKPMPTVFSGAAADLFPNLVCGAADEIPFIDGHVTRGLKIDTWWRDAGWYPCGDTWWNTGTWEPDPKRYPGGLKAVADKAHENGMKLTVWFEPERAVPGSWLAQNHPEWLLGPRTDSMLLDLGNPEARQWTTERIDQIITTNGIDMYRQDFNMPPLPFWRAADAEDRQGITEIRHIEGLLAMWDELARRHPNMPFDCCASGGRRVDLEMMRRGLPLSKSDYAGGTTSSQSQLYGIASWLPYYGAGLGASEDPYVLRSNLAPWSAECWDTRSDALNYEGIRRFIDEWRRVSPYLLKDYYPLTPYSLAEDIWMAWQFDSPEDGAGVVQAFCRPKAGADSITVRLRGLVASARYRVEDFDTGEVRTLTGRTLMTTGLRVSIGSQPGAAIVEYRRER